MKNREVSQLLYEIANLLELRGEIVFKVRAYRRAAQAVESLSKPIEEIASEGKLSEIPGVGQGIAEKIEDFLKTGKSSYYEKMKKKMPIDFEALMSIEGMGPKKVLLLYKKLKIKNVRDLEAAAKAGKLSKLRGLGEKSEQKILQAIELSRSGGGRRVLLGFALPISDEIIAYMKKSPHVGQITAAGSLRRMKETIGDIDILVSSKDAAHIIDHFCAMPDVMDIIAKGPTKASMHLKSGLQVDLRVLQEHEFGAALNYFTGSKEHNIELRKMAISKGLKLSEYGLFRGAKIVAGHTEQEVYSTLGLQYIEPEMREMQGEIEAARKGALPNLIKLEDIKGDLQMHTKWSDGTDTIESMARRCQELGYEYLCVTDHVGNLKIAHALSEQEVGKQRKEIESLQQKFDIRILQGAEVDIRLDGSFDVSNKCLKSLDIVVASMHSALQKPKDVNTQRILTAMENPNIDIIGHLTGRKIDNRPPADLDIQKIIQKSLETGTILEIDGYMDRMDLSDVNAKAAIDAGCKLVIDTDSHSTEHLRFMRLGVANARRAWATKDDILNTLPFKKFAKEFDIST